MAFGRRFVLSIRPLLISIPGAESQTRARRNFYGIHHLKDGGAPTVERLAAHAAASR